MEHTTSLPSKIGLIEEEIEAKYRDDFQAREKGIDFAQPDWMAEMKQFVIDYRKAIQPELNYIREIVVAALKDNDYKNIREVAALIEATNRLKKNIVPAPEELNDHDSLLLALSLFVIRDLKPDARDSMLYFSELTKQCKAKKIDIRPILEKLLPYTSTDVQFGDYSMRALFQQTIEQSTPIRKLKK